jgi:hypothetical protein
MKKLANVIIFLLFLVIFYSLARILMMYIQFYNDYQFRISTYIPAFLAASATFVVFYFLHFRVYAHLTEVQRLKSQARVSGVAALLCIGTYGIFYAFNRGSAFLYEINNCIGGLGSGVSCPTGPADLIGGLVALNTIMAFVGLGSLMVTLFATGVIFAIQWFWLKRKQKMIKTV